VATLTEANASLSKQLEDNSNELRELKALLEKERTERTERTEKTKKTKKRKERKEDVSAVSIHHQTITGGHTGKRSTTLTQV
jgi:hypothetical protein